MKTPEEIQDWLDKKPDSNDERYITSWHKFNKNLYESDLYNWYKKEVESYYSDKLSEVAGQLPNDNDKPWPTKDILSKLIFASEYLLNEKSYDGHDYEEIQICVKRAKEILNNLQSSAKHRQQAQGDAVGFAE